MGSTLAPTPQPITLAPSKTEGIFDISFYSASCLFDDFVSYYSDGSVKTGDVVVFELVHETTFEVLMTFNATYPNSAVLRLPRPMPIAWAARRAFVRAYKLAEPSIVSRPPTSNWNFATLSCPFVSLVAPYEQKFNCGDEVAAQVFFDAVASDAAMLAGMSFDVKLLVQTNQVEAIGERDTLSSHR